MLNLFDRTLAKHDDYTKRTLAGLRSLGFDFPTIAAAYRWRAEQKKLLRNDAEAISYSAVQAEKRRARK